MKLFSFIKFLLEDSHGLIIFIPMAIFFTYETIRLLQHPVIYYNAIYPAILGGMAWFFVYEFIDLSWENFKTRENEN